MLEGTGVTIHYTTSFCINWGALFAMSTRDDNVVRDILLCVG